MENKEYFLRQKQRFQEELLRYSLPLWTEHGPDREHGGIFTCFDRKWQLYSHDKNGWQQGRAAWTFSRFCNQYGNREDYLAIAKSALDFLEAHFIDPTGEKMYYSTTGDGTPVRKRRFPYRGTEVFYVNGLAEYARATGDADCLRRARKWFSVVQRVQDGRLKPPAGEQPKYQPVRAARSFGQPMVFLDTCDIMLRADPENEGEYRAMIQLFSNEIVHYFIKEELRCALENVGPNGEFLSDWTTGREVNPGHGLEGVWFLMRAADTLKNDAIREKAIKLYDFCLEKGWDHEYGGILMFVDALGHPPEKYEHDMKFWWVIDEAICSALTLYRFTRQERYLKDFERFADYYFTCFSDREHGGCFGYLRRDGKPTEPAPKGNMFKGPFHNPRMMMYVDTLLDELIRKAETAEEGKA